MRWIDDYQVFLFDFDGLLVNTEEVHYHAYQLACRHHGLEMPWTFPEYCTMAHYRAEALQEKLCALFPKIKEIGWDSFYKLKTDIIEKLVNEGQVELMPGVADFLKKLEQANKIRCVVTHSPDKLVDPIRKQHPILNTIPVWITRASYKHPKPDPECYLTAIERLATPDQKVIGFEDTPRGMTALFGTRAKPVIISKIPYPEIPDFIKRGATHYESFSAIPNNQL